MKKKISLIILLVLIIYISTVYAHGANITYNANTEYEITAKFDDGTPISGGQVTIYSPENPSEPYITGICDDQGKYSFKPDTNQTGDWFIMVRKAGHGADLTINTSNSSNTNNNTSIGQKIIMIICFVWGCLGTALYFKRR